MTLARIRLIVFAVAFVGWLAWLGYAVTQRGTAPILSRAQLIASTDLIVAEVTTSGDGTPTTRVLVREAVRGADGVDPGGSVTVTNLPAAIVPAETGEEFQNLPAGDYLLPLVKVSDGTYRIAGLPRSPGLEPAAPARPVVYPWSATTREQLQSLGVISGR